MYYKKYRAITEGNNRVLRGGSWNNNAGNCRVADRNNNTPDNRWNNTGFRTVFALQLREGMEVLFVNRFLSCCNLEYGKYNAREALQG
jgi:hypothetical protein